VSDNLREQLGRLAVFLLIVVIASICLGMLLSTLHLAFPVAKTVALVATSMTAIVSYFASYKPGWIYNSLVDASKEEE
jgi:hypothetical protein